MCGPLAFRSAPSLHCVLGLQHQVAGVGTMVPPRTSGPIRWPSGASRQRKSGGTDGGATLKPQILRNAPVRLRRRPALGCAPSLRLQHRHARVSAQPPLQVPLRLLPARAVRAHRSLRACWPCLGPVPTQLAPHAAARRVFRRGHEPAIVQAAVRGAVGMPE